MLSTELLVEKDAAVSSSKSQIKAKSWHASDYDVASLVDDIRAQRRLNRKGTFKEANLTLAAEIKKENEGLALQRMSTLKNQTMSKYLKYMEMLGMQASDVVHEDMFVTATHELTRKLQAKDLKREVRMSLIRRRRSSQMDIRSDKSGRANLKTETA